MTYQEDNYEDEEDEDCVDYDLHAALYYNNVGFSSTSIASVLAVWEGQHDGDNWAWIVQLKNDEYYYITGGCDYTGWDCQSSASATKIETPEEGAEIALNTYGQYGEGTPVTMKNMLSRLMGEEVTKTQGEWVALSLHKQLQEGKDETWREKMDKELL